MQLTMNFIFLTHTSLSFKKDKQTKKNHINKKKKKKHLHKPPK